MAGQGQALQEKTIDLPLAVARKKLFVRQQIHMITRTVRYAEQEQEMFTMSNHDVKVAYFQEPNPSHNVMQRGSKHEIVSTSTDLEMSSEDWTKYQE